MTRHTRRQALAAGVTVTLGASAGCLDETGRRDVTVLDRDGVITGVETAVHDVRWLGVSVAKSDANLRVTIDDGGEHAPLQIVLVGPADNTEVATYRAGDDAVVFEEAGSALFGEVEPGGDAATVLALDGSDVVGSASFRVVRT